MRHIPDVEHVAKGYDALPGRPRSAGNAAMVETTDPNILARHAVRVLVSAGTGRRIIRQSFPGRDYLTCEDSLGCYVFVPCDINGNALPART